jgi:hypothetical protein
LGTESANLFQFLCGSASHAPQLCCGMRHRLFDHANYFVTIKANGFGILAQNRFVWILG